MKGFVTLMGIVLLVTAVAGNVLAQTTVVVNEAYSRGTAGNLDWVEVYNRTGSPIDISGYMIYDNGGQAGTKAKKLFPAGTVLPPLGFYVIITDTNTSTTGTPDDFGLGSGGDKVWLEDGAGTPIDSMTIPALGNDTSWARVPDGSDTYAKLSPASRGTANSPAPAVTVNEAYSRGTAGNLDWIEVYNSTPNPIDISGYKIYDNGGLGGTKPKKEFPAGTTLPALGFYVIITDTNTSSTVVDGFGLGSGGDKVWLEDLTGTIIDSMEIPALGIDTSWARVPDGSPLYVKLSPVTRGATNGTTTSVGDEPTLATSFALDQNYPNPFNPSTTIAFSAPVDGHATLKVYNALGQEVATLFEGEMEAGTYRNVRFESDGLSTGTYFARLSFGGQQRMIKMMLIK